MLSYELLPENLQRLWRRLAVFPRSFSIESALFVSPPEVEIEEDLDEKLQAALALETMGDLLDQLQSYSLLEYLPETGRYQMHDTVREAARVQLEAAGEVDSAYRRLGEFEAAFFAQHGVLKAENLALVTLEKENLFAAAAWAEQERQADLLARLVTVPSNWLQTFSVWESWQRWLETALQLGINDPGLEANTRRAMGDVYRFRDDYDAALGAYEEALRLYAQTGSRLGEANTRRAIGDVYQFRKELDAALGAYEEALRLYAQTGSRLGEANTRRAMGDVYGFRDDYDAALGAYEEALRLYAQTGSRVGEANTRQAMGDVYQFRKELDAALGAYEEALRLYAQTGDRQGEANTRKAMGDVYGFRNDYDAALGAYEEALRLYTQTGDRQGEANTLAALSRLYVQQGELQKAEKMFVQVGQIRQEIVSVYDQGADHGNFAIVLLQNGFF